MSRRSDTPGLAEPISKPRYSCVESQASTSPPNRSANHTPSEDFPDAVGPTTATKGCSAVRGFIEREYAKRGGATQRVQAMRVGDFQEPAVARSSLLLIVAVRRDVVEVGVAQFDVGPAELRRQRLEGVRGAHGRIGGAVERLFARVAVDDRFRAGYAAIPHNLERQDDYAFLTKLDGLGHHGKPVAFHRDVHALEIAAPV